MEMNKYKFTRSFKTKKQCNSFISIYGLTVFEIKKTSFKREYQGRIVTRSKYTVNYA